MAGLALISVLAGAGMLWVFARVSDQEAIRRAKRRLSAALLEMRLYGDEPALLWGAQKALLKANARYLALMARPLAVLGLPMVLLLWQLDAFYGLAPLAVGRPAVVTAQLREALDSKTPAPRLEVPQGIVVETPAVRVAGRRQASWRVRPSQAVAGRLRVVSAGGQTAEAPITAAGGRKVRRTDLNQGAVEWIEISYPESRLGWGGFQWHWLVWFFLFSLASALVVKSRMGVAL